MQYLQYGQKNQMLSFHFLDNWCPETHHVYYDRYSVHKLTFSLLNSYLVATRLRALITRPVEWDFSDILLSRLFPVDTQCQIRWHVLHMFMSHPDGKIIESGHVFWYRSTLVRHPQPDISVCLWKPSRPCHCWLKQQGQNKCLSPTTTQICQPGV